MVSKQQTLLPPKLPISEKNQYSYTMLPQVHNDKNTGLFRATTLVTLLSTLYSIILVAFELVVFVSVVFILF